MDWHKEGKDCMDVLAMSYEDLPCDLKSCFMYLALFPEDYEISANGIVRIWVAEGFVPKEERKTMEETAEEYLEDLVQRCMVQVSRRSVNGSITFFGVHDLLRDLAIHEAEEVNFVTVFSKAQRNRSNRVTRRASLQSYLPKNMTSDDKFVAHVGPDTRSLLWFGPKDVILKIEPRRENYSDFKLLRVLEIVDVKRELELRGLDKLIHLKYLRIRDSFVCMEKNFSFRSLKNLETLEVRTAIGIRIEIPQDGLWTIGTLRHVIYLGLRGPPPEANLANLQTLQWVRFEETWPANQFSHLNNLRKLGLRITYHSNLDVVRHLLGHMSCLISLGVRLKILDLSERGQSTAIPNEIVYPTVLPNYENLQSLRLEGRWSQGVTLDASLFPPRLLKLKLIGSKLDQDPMPELGKLTSLKKLTLGDKVYDGVQMNCPSGFPVLQNLMLMDPYVSSIKIAQGAMPKLKYVTKAESYVELDIMPPERHNSLKVKNLN